MGTDKITQRSQGEVDDSGKVNWRGDQVSLGQGGQSIYQASQVQLAQLGSRKVVGDRVFRYARAGAAIAQQQLNKAPATADGENNVTQTTCGQHNIGQRTMNLYSALAVDANAYAEGYVMVADGTSVGPMYRIKSHGAISKTATGELTLYDPLVTTHTAADEVSVFRNMYNLVLEFATIGDVPVGVSPVAATTNDYFWMQTWGPCAIAQSTGTGIVAQGGLAFPGVTGAVQAATAAGTMPDIGYGMYLGTANIGGAVYLKIAP